MKSVSVDIADSQPLHMYRADIDGLRAISVLAVVAFHAFPAFIHGGFIGVDVFFVISGFLITGIILNEIELRRFSIINFYIKRILRIFPALIIVLSVAYILGWSILYGDEFKLLALHIIGGATFTSNVVLWTEAGYFDVASATKPLLHLWSLGVEEQFYIIWPMFLLLGRRLNVSQVFLIVLLAVASFVVDVATIDAHPTAAFYLPFGRLWELAAGGCVAAARRTNARISAAGADVLSVVGLAAIVGSAILLSESQPFPGWRALSPVLGAAAVIAAGPRAIVNRSILSWRRLVWVGRLSYPLYLWHWILLSFGFVLAGGTPPWASRVALLAIALLASWATWRFVEGWVRNGQRSRLKASGLCLAMLALTIVALITWVRDGLPFRKGSDYFADISTASEGAGKDLTLKECLVPAPQSSHDFFCQRDRRGPSRVLMWGDSKAEALYWGMVRSTTTEQRWSLAGRWGCSPLQGLNPNSGRNDAVNDLCDSVTRSVLQALETDKLIATVVLVFSSTHIAGADSPLGPNVLAAEEDLNRTVGRLTELGKKVILVIDNPNLADPRKCMDRAALGWGIVRFILQIERDESQIRRCDRPLADHLRETRAYREAIDRAAARNPGLVIYDPTHILCDIERGVCPMVRNRKYLYSYGNHVSDAASDLIAAELTPLLPPLKQ